MTAESWATTFKGALLALAFALAVTAAEPVPQEPGPADVRAAVVEPEEHPLADPCPGPDDTELAVRARCWIDAAYEVLGGPPAEADVAYAVAEAESRFRTGVKNPKSSATGLFQFVKGTWRRVTKVGPWFMRDWDLEDRKDGWRNALAAVWLAGRDEWRGHWQVCNNYRGAGSGSVKCGSAGGWLR